jgi:hypothetical protein
LLDRAAPVPSVTELTHVASEPTSPISTSPISNGRAGDNIFKFADDLSPEISFTRIGAIYAVANYWKHHEERPKGWREGDKSRLIVWNENEDKGYQRRTLEIVTALGMSQEGIWNLLKTKK